MSNLQELLDAFHDSWVGIGGGEFNRAEPPTTLEWEVAADRLGIEVGDIPEQVREWFDWSNGYAMPVTVGDEMMRFGFYTIGLEGGVELGRALVGASEWDDELGDAAAGPQEPGDGIVVCYLDHLHFVASVRPHDAGTIWMRDTMKGLFGKVFDSLVEMVEFYQGLVEAELFAEYFGQLRLAVQTRPGLADYPMPDLVRAAFGLYALDPPSA